METGDASHATGSRGVRSLERAFELLEHLADGGGEMALSELTDASGLPMPTIYRLMRTLVNQGYVRQEASRRYALGPRLIRLGESASRLLGTWARPFLTELVDEVGETANMALLDGDDVVYVAQAPSKHSVRMFTEVGRHVHPHCTGVGKALLAQLPAAAAGDLLARSGLPAHTANTITDPEAMLSELEQIRRDGYAIDDGEQELGRALRGRARLRVARAHRHLDLRSRRPAGTRRRPTGGADHAAYGGETGRGATRPWRSSLTQFAPAVRNSAFTT